MIIRSLLGTPDLYLDIKFGRPNMWAWETWICNRARTFDGKRGLWGIDEDAPTIWFDYLVCNLGMYIETRSLVE